MKTVTPMTLAAASKSRTRIRGRLTLAMLLAAMLAVAMMGEPESTTSCGKQATSNKTKGAKECVSRNSERKEVTQRASTHPPPLRAHLGMMLPSDGGAERMLPILVGSAVQPKAYLTWMLRRGGQVILVRGAKYRPVARLKPNWEVTPISKFEPPGRVARDVTTEYVAAGGVLHGATRVLLFWPPGVQRAVERLLRDAAFGRADRVQASFNVRNQRLHIQVERFRSAGKWISYCRDLTL